MKYGKLGKAAKEWGVHYRTILSWAAKGKIKYKVQPSGSKQYGLPSQILRLKGSFASWQDLKTPELFPSTLQL